MKKYFSVMLAIALAAAGTGLVHAQSATTSTSVSSNPGPLITSPSTTTSSSPSGTSTTTTVTTATPVPATLLSVPEVVQIGSDGTILIRGTVESANANALTIGTWGGTWTIETTVTTDLIPSVATIASVSNIPVGDYVGVAGTVSETSPLTVEATIVHDWTVTDGIAAPSIPLTTTVTTTTATPTTTTAPESSFTGKVNSTGNNTFTLAGSDGTNYIVNTNSTTEITSMNGTATNFALLQAGDTVNVTGTLSNSDTITAVSVEDTAR